MSRSLYSSRFLKLTSRLLPEFFWSGYARMARELGLDNIRLILSFDCDTPEDIPAAEKIFSWLHDRGMKAVFAVPGVLLEQAADVYHKIAEQGVEFINHGAQPHVEWRDGRYWSITYYHELSPEEVVDDISKGHEIVTKVTGHTPRGFRAPHFGLFQEPEQLALQYNVLRELDYRFSTSTMPVLAFHRGPAYKTNSLYEIPLMGTYRKPFDLLDSWSHIISPYQPKITEQYAKHLLDTLESLKRKGFPALLNYYVDPAHVCDSGSFYQALEYYQERGVIATTYNEFLDSIVP